MATLLINAELAVCSSCHAPLVLREHRLGAATVVLGLAVLLAVEVVLVALWAGPLAGPLDD